MDTSESLALPKGYRMREARKLFGFAMRQNAEDTYQLLDRPRLDALSHRVSWVTASAYHETFGEPTGAQDLLLYGVVDTMRLIVPVLNMHQTLDKEIALKIAAHPETVVAHAIAANQAQAQAGMLVYSRQGEVFDLNSTQDAIEIKPGTLDLEERRGCEAVTVTNGAVEAEPVFRQFTVWAGELAVHSYFDHSDHDSADPVLF